MVDPSDLWLRESVRDLQARYNANGDSGRMSHVIELFAPDGVLELMDETCHGRDEIRQLFERTAASLRGHTDVPLLRHHTSTLQIDVLSPTSVRSRAYFQVLTGAGLDHWGRYLDEFEVVDGRLLFSHRKVVTEGATPGGWAATT